MHENSGMYIKGIIIIHIACSNGQIKRWPLTSLTSPAARPVSRDRPIIMTMISKSTLARFLHVRSPYRRLLSARLAKIQYRQG